MDFYCEQATTNKGQASSAIAMKAGNDLIMPGGADFKKEILEQSCLPQPLSLQ